MLQKLIFLNLLSQPITDKDRNFAKKSQKDIENVTPFQFIKKISKTLSLKQPYHQGHANQ